MANGDGKKVEVPIEATGVEETKRALQDVTQEATKAGSAMDKAQRSATTPAATPSKFSQNVAGTLRKFQIRKYWAKWDKQ